jgi:hypothetical protein
VQVAVDGQEVRLPERDYRGIAEQIAELQQEDKALDVIFSRVAASLSLIDADCGRLKEQLQGLKVNATAQREADGELIVLEGWAEADTAKRVDKMLEAYPNLVYMRRDATIDDDAPVKLKNNKFARLFELIGAMYSLPKYGTLDLTPCPDRNTAALKRLGMDTENTNQIFMNTLFLPQEYFCPMDYYTGKKTITQHTYSIHHYCATWTSSVTKRTTKIKRLLGVKLYNKLYGKFLHKFKWLEW